MRLSTHYYVLSLSEQTNQLYECFRDTLIEVRDQGFPVEASTSPGSMDECDEEARDLLRVVDQRLAHYYEQDPLRLIVVGEARLRSVFEAVTAHRDIVIGGIEGDHTATSPRDLGQIVWPIVKEAMSGLGNMALRELEIAEKAKTLLVGLKDVGQHSNVEVGSTLFVEEDYHIRGSMKKVDQTVFVSHDIDVREVMDDVVDTVIEKVLEIGGSVVFMSKGSLARQKRIALIPSGAEDPQ